MHIFIFVTFTNCIFEANHQIDMIFFLTKQYIFILIEN